MLFCILMPVILLIRYAYTMDFQNQGRYLLPAVIPLMYYLTRGLEKLSTYSRLPRKLQQPMAKLLILFTILLPTLSTLSMTYITALPVYMETGVVLPT